MAVSVKSLWGEAFEVKETPAEVKKVVEKIKSSKKVETKTTAQLLNSRKLTLHERLNIITEDVHRILGGYEEDTQVIRTREELHDYISAAVENNIIAVDTETNNSLDPLTCKLMGLCIYTPGQKNAYVPVNHVDPDTLIKLDNQVTEEEIAEELRRLDNVYILMHNGSFDYQVIKCTCDVALHLDWDTMIAAKILDENEQAGLKWQYVNKIDPSIEKYSITHLFNKVEYAVVDPNLFALYAATDAYMTYKLYLWQKDAFEMDTNKAMYSLFKDVEMPIVLISAEMELAGIHIDVEYANKLSAFYREKERAVEEKIAKELEKLEPTISAWRLTAEANKKTPKADKPGEFNKSKNEQLENPPKVSSSVQLAILLYDVLKFPVVDKSSPRGTGEEILTKLTKEQNFALGESILELRGLEKLLNTFIEKMPTSLSPRDGRLHAHFSQYGAATGRFSSSGPNLQNIPSSNKNIRLEFVAAPGKVLVGGDFSQQEPRLAAYFAQDEAMINAYKEKKDLYATMAAQVYGNDYWDNMEVTEDGAPNPAGKKRRGSVKSIALG